MACEHCGNYEGDEHVDWCQSCGAEICLDCNWEGYCPFCVEDFEDDDE